MADGSDNESDGSDNESDGLWADEGEKEDYKTLNVHREQLAKYNSDTVKAAITKLDNGVELTEEEDEELTAADKDWYDNYRISESKGNTWAEKFEQAKKYSEETIEDTEDRIRKRNEYYQNLEEDLAKRDAFYQSLKEELAKRAEQNKNDDDASSDSNDDDSD